jgi:hypothetical protein
VVAIKQRSSRDFPCARVWARRVCLDRIFSPSSPQPSQARTSASDWNRARHLRWLAMPSRTLFRLRNCCIDTLKHESSCQRRHLETRHTESLASVEREHVSKSPKPPFPLTAGQTSMSNSSALVHTDSDKAESPDDNPDGSSLAQRVFSIEGQ